MSEQNAIVQKPGFLAPVIGVQQALEAYQAKKDLIDGIMEEGVDFITIPGTSKPTLSKAGAEKSTSFFGLFPRFKDAGIVEDWTGENHGGEPFFYYRRTCELWRGDQLVASVDGSCNSWEKKYRYRWVDESNIPSSVDKSKLKTQGGKISEFAFAIDKSETSGKYGKPAEYWKRFKDAIANGSAKSIKRKTAKGEADAWEIDGTLYCLPNEDPGDIVNTVLKMADKRALVAATLIATGMSAYFTQDVEDYIDAEFKNVPEPVARKVVQETGEIVDVEPPFTVEEANAFLNSKGVPYGDIETETLRHMADALANSKHPTPEDQNKITRIQIILKDRASKETLVETAKQLGAL